MDKNIKLSQYILQAIQASEVCFTGSCNGVINGDGTINVTRQNGNSVNAIAANITGSGDCSVFLAQGQYYAFSTSPRLFTNERSVINVHSKPVNVSSFIFGYAYQMFLSASQLLKYEEYDSSLSSLIISSQYDLAFYKQIDNSKAIVLNNVYILAQKNVPVLGSNPPTTTNIVVLSTQGSNASGAFDLITSRSPVSYNSIIGSTSENNTFHVFRGNSYFDWTDGSKSLFSPIFDYFKINLSSKQIIGTNHYFQNSVQSLPSLPTTSLPYLSSEAVDPFFQIIKYQDSQNIIRLVCFGGCIRGSTALIWDMGTPENWQMPNNPACFSVITLSVGISGHKFVYGAVGGIVITLAEFDPPPSRVGTNISIGGYTVAVGVNDSQIFIPESNLIGTAGNLATGIIGESASISAGLYRTSFTNADSVMQNQELIAGTIPPPLDTRVITLLKPKVNNAQVSPNIFYPISLADSGKQIFK
jgi:hypothetical protein